MTAPRFKRGDRVLQGDNEGLVVEVLLRAEDHRRYRVRWVPSINKPLRFVSEKLRMSWEGSDSLRPVPALEQLAEESA